MPAEHAAGGEPQDRQGRQHPERAGDGFGRRGDLGAAQGRVYPRQVQPGPLVQGLVLRGGCLQGGDALDDLGQVAVGLGLGGDLGGHAVPGGPEGEGEQRHLGGDDGQDDERHRRVGDRHHGEVEGDHHQVEGGGEDLRGEQLAQHADAACAQHDVAGPAALEVVERQPQQVRAEADHRLGVQTSLQVDDQRSAQVAGDQLGGDQDEDAAADQREHPVSPGRDDLAEDDQDQGRHGQAEQLGDDGHAEQLREGEPGPGHAEQGRGVTAPEGCRGSGPPRESLTGLCRQHDPAEAGVELGHGHAAVAAARIGDVDAPATGMFYDHEVVAAPVGDRRTQRDLAARCRGPGGRPPR